MKVKELQEILADYHPDDEVGVRSASKRNMTILGVDADACVELGHLVFSVDFTIKDVPVESPRDKLLRQEEEIRKAIAIIDKEELRAAVTKKRQKSKKNRSKTQQLLDGYIPDGRRGRPKKIITEADVLAAEAKKERGPGRPKKNPGGVTDEKPKKVSQDFSQLDELLGL